MKYVSPSVDIVVLSLEGACLQVGSPLIGHEPQGNASDYEIEEG